MKKGIIIQARTGSTRFPRKVMADLIGKPVIWHVIERAKKSKLADIVVVATTTLRNDKVIENVASEQEVEFFQGNENDVLDRYYQAAKKFNVDIIVRITGDCPLVDPEIIDNAIETIINGRYGYVSNVGEPYADGFDVEVFTFKELEKAWENSEWMSEREHVTPYIRKNCKNTLTMNNDPRSAKLHCSIDRREDLEFIKKIYKGMIERGLDHEFTYKQVLDYIDNNPAIKKINEWHEINEGYKKSLKEDKKINL